MADGRARPRWGARLPVVRSAGLNVKLSAASSVAEQDDDDPLRAAADAFAVTVRSVAG